MLGHPAMRRAVKLSFQAFQPRRADNQKRRVRALVKFFW